MEEGDDVEDESTLDVDEKGEGREDGGAQPYADEGVEEEDAVELEDAENDGEQEDDGEGAEAIAESNKNWCD